jgi:hypothetical protein
VGAIPADAVLLALATWGAIADSRYQLSGGRTPTKRERMLFLAATLLLMVPLFATLVLLKAIYPLLLAFIFLEAGIVLFAVWELGRWRVRRKNPVVANNSTA